MNMLESIGGYNFVVIDKYAYFSNMYFNAFFKVEIKTGKTVFLGSFDGEELAENNIHYEIMLENNRIYFFPRRGRHMHIYYLSEETMQTVKIREASEDFYVINEIFLGDNFIYFIPKQKNHPIKKLERKTYTISKVSDGAKIQGKYLSGYRKSIPAPIREKFHFRYEPSSSCEQMADGSWCCFMPFGRQIVCFKEGIYNPKTISLTVVNDMELKKHLCKVKQNLFKARMFFWEFESFKSQNFLEEIVQFDVPGWNCFDGKNRYSIGEAVWDILKG